MVQLQTMLAVSLKCQNFQKKFAKELISLDAVGNTTAAIGKGFAIGSAALTSLALFAAFRETVGGLTLDINNPTVMAGLLNRIIITICIFSSCNAGGWRCCF